MDQEKDELKSMIQGLMERLTKEEWHETRMEWAGDYLKEIVEDYSDGVRDWLCDDCDRIDPENYEPMRDESRD